MLVLERCSSSNAFVGWRSLEIAPAIDLVSIALVLTSTGQQVDRLRFVGDPLFFWDAGGPLHQAARDLEARRDLGSPSSFEAGFRFNLGQATLRMLCE